MSILKKKKNWSFKIIVAETIQYSSSWVNKLKDAVNFTNNDLEDLNVSYTNYLASIINRFILINDINLIDAVCSHGHTILHQPQNKITLQIGNLPNLSSLINQNVVCDFRVQDVNLGGQGAPLVPIGDKLLFSQFNYCVNLGGFSNISFDDGLDRMAYDICPVNIVLNHYVSQLGLPFDDKGLIAASGIINDELLNKLNGLSYYERVAPKSLGLEWVDKFVFPLIDEFKLPIKDVLRTFIEHIAIQISASLVSKKSSALFTGGGVYNSFLMERIDSLSDVRIKKSEPVIIEYKEALIFAFLGVLRLRNEDNVLASVTGAIKNHCSGFVFLKN